MHRSTKAKNWKIWFSVEVLNIIISASTTLYQTTETKYYSQSSNNATEFPTEPEMVENEAWAVLKSQEYE